MAKFSLSKDKEIRWRVGAWAGHNVMEKSRKKMEKQRESWGKARRSGVGRGRVRREEERRLALIWRNQVLGHQRPNTHRRKFDGQVCCSDDSRDIDIPRLSITGSNAMRGRIAQLKSRDFVEESEKRARIEGIDAPWPSSALRTNLSVHLSSPLLYFISLFFSDPSPDRYPATPRPHPPPQPEQSALHAGEGEKVSPRFIMHESDVLDNGRVEKEKVASRGWNRRLPFAIRLIPDSFRELRIRSNEESVRRLYASTGRFLPEIETNFPSAPRHHPNPSLHPFLSPPLSRHPPPIYVLVYLLLLRSLASIIRNTFRSLSDTCFLFFTLREAFSMSILKATAAALYSKILFFF
jgi:hypothetical protein